MPCPFLTLRSKSETVEKLLLHIRESPVGDQVIKIILDSAALASPSAATSSLGATPSFASALVPTFQSSAANDAQCSQRSTKEKDIRSPVDACPEVCTHVVEPKPQSLMVSPLDVLATAVTAVSSDSTDASSNRCVDPSLGHLSYEPPMRDIADQASFRNGLVRYIGQL